MTYSIPQRLAGEFVGTFVLVFIGVGSLCANQFAGGGSGLLGVAFAFGLCIAVMVASLGHISGAHFNPAVTAALWVTKRMDTMESLLYWMAQVAGSLAAAFVLTLVVPEDSWRAVQLGATSLAKDVTHSSGMLLEGIGTFILVFVVFATAVDSRAGVGKLAGLIIGFAITMDILLIGPFTGAALNPARAVGPAIIAKFWVGHGIYWVGPLAGGIVAGWLYDKLFLARQGS